MYGVRSIHRSTMMTSMSVYYVVSDLSGEGPWPGHDDVHGVVFVEWKVCSPRVHRPTSRLRPACPLHLDPLCSRHARVPRVLLRVARPSCPDASSSASRVFIPLCPPGGFPRSLACCPLSFHSQPTHRPAEAAVRFVTAERYRKCETFPWHSPSMHGTSRTSADSILR